ARLLEVGEVGRVVHDPHRIGLGEADADGMAEVVGGRIRGRFVGETHGPRRYSVTTEWVRVSCSRSSERVAHLGPPRGELLLVRFWCLAEAHQDQIERRHTQDALAFVTVGPEGAEIVAECPPVRAVPTILLGVEGARGPAVVDPTGGKDAPTVPDAVT